MPRYTFDCEKCGAKIEVVCSVEQVREPWYCKCGTEMYRDFNFHARSHGSGSGGGYRKKITSDSLAISPRQIAEHKAMFPDIDLDDQCRPVFDNYKAHQKYLDQCNLQKLPQKRKIKGERIA